MTSEKLQKIFKLILSALPSLGLSKHTAFGPALSITPLCSPVSSI